MNSYQMYWTKTQAFILIFVFTRRSGEYGDVIEAELAVTIDVSLATQRTPLSVGRRR